jgi:hypothetical protein
LNIGNLTGAQQQAILQGAGQLANLQQQANAQQLTAAGQYGQQAQTLGNLTATQQANLANMGATAATAAGADAARAQAAAGALAQLAVQEQGLRAADVAALEAAGQAQQRQQQAELTAAQNQYYEQLNYPRSQVEWLNNQLRGIAPYVPTTTSGQGQGTGQTYSASPLSQIAQLALFGTGLARTN